MDIQVVLSQMAVLFLLIAAGYFSGKIKMISPDGVKTLSKIVINISTPSVILNSVLGGTEGITGSKTAYFILMVLLAYILFFLIAIPSARALGASEGSDASRNAECRTQNAESGDVGELQCIVYSVQCTDMDGGSVVRLSNNSGLYTSMIVFGNVGFMGYPVVQAIFGDDAMFYAVLLNVIFNMLVYSTGIVMISGKGEKIKLRLIINVNFIVSLIALIIAFTGFRAPFVLTEAIRLASGINTPCAMLVIGATLAQIPVRNVFTKWQLYPVALLKTVVVPVVIWLVFKRFVTENMLLGLLVVLSGMPIAAAVPMVAVEYGGNEDVASSGVFLTTLLSAATIPLIVFLLLR